MANHDGPSKRALVALIVLNALAPARAAAHEVASNGSVVAPFVFVAATAALRARLAPTGDDDSRTTQKGGSPRREASFSRPRALAD